MNIPKTVYTLSGILIFLAVLHFYGKSLQRSSRLRTNKSKLSSLRFNASLVPSALPKPRQQRSIVETREAIGSTAMEIADNYLLTQRQEIGIRDYHEARGVEYKTPLGTSVKYSFYQDGLPLLGLEVEIQVKDGQVIDMVNAYRPVEKAEVSEEDYLSNEEMSQVIPERFKAEGTQYKNSEPVLFVTPTDDVVFSYVIQTRDRGRDKPVSVVMRADDGQILNFSTSRSEF